MWHFNNNSGNRCILFFVLFPLITWVSLELSRIIGKDGEKDPGEGKAEQVPSPAVYVPWGYYGELGSAKV